MTCTTTHLGGLRRATAREVLDAAARVAEIAGAAGLDAADARLARRDAVAAVRSRLDPVHGYGGRIVPIFISSGARPTAGTEGNQNRQPV